MENNQKPEDRRHEAGSRIQEAENQEVETKAEQNLVANVVPYNVLERETNSSIARFATLIAILCRGDTGSKNRQRGIEVLETTQATLAKNIKYLLNHQIGEKGIRSKEELKKYSTYLDNYLKGAAHALKTEADFAKPLFSILKEERERICGIIDTYNLPETLQSDEKAKKLKIDFEKIQGNDLLDLLPYFESPEHCAGEIIDSLQGMLAEDAELLKIYLTENPNKENPVLNGNEDISKSNLKYAIEVLGTYEYVINKIIYQLVLNSLKQNKSFHLNELIAKFINSSNENLCMFKNIESISDNNVIDDFLRDIKNSMTLLNLEKLFSYELKKIPQGIEFFMPHKAEWMKRVNKAKTNNRPMDLNGYDGPLYNTLDAEELKIVCSYQKNWLSMADKTEKTMRDIKRECCNEINSERHGGFEFVTSDNLDKYFQLEEASKSDIQKENLSDNIKTVGTLNEQSILNIQQKITRIIHKHLDELRDRLLIEGAIDENEQISRADINYLTRFLSICKKDITEEAWQKLAQSKNMTVSVIADCIKAMNNFPKTGLRPSEKTKKTVENFIDYLIENIKKINIYKFPILPTNLVSSFSWDIGTIMPKTVKWQEIRDKAIQEGAIPNFEEINFDISKLSKEEKEFIIQYHQDHIEKWKSIGYKEYNWAHLIAKEVNNKFRGGLKIRTSKDVEQILAEELKPKEKNKVEEMLDWVASIDTSNHKQWIQALVGVLKNPEAKEIDIKSALSVLGYLRSIYTKTQGHIQKHRFNIDTDKQGMIRALMPSTVIGGEPSITTAQKDEKTDFTSITIDKLDEKADKLEKIIAERKTNLENELKELPKVPKNKGKRDKEILDTQKNIGHLKGQLIILTANAKLLERSALHEPEGEKKNKLNEELAHYQEQIKTLEKEITELEAKGQKFMESLLNRSDIQEKIEKTTAELDEVGKIKDEINNVRENIVKKVFDLEQKYINEK